MTLCAQALHQLSVGSIQDTSDTWILGLRSVGFGYDFDIEGWHAGFKVALTLNPKTPNLGCCASALRRDAGFRL